MISNPQKLCMVHARKCLLYVMRYAAAMKVRSKTDKDCDAWHSILLDIGRSSESLKEEIRLLPDMVEEARPEWIIKANYIREYGNYEDDIKFATDTILQSA